MSTSVVVEAGNARRPCVHLVLSASFGSLVSETNDLGGVAQTMSSQSCLGRLTHMFLTGYEFLRFIGAVSIAGSSIGRIAHLRLGFIPIGSSHLL